jgi:hypothetical protein
MIITITVNTNNTIAYLRVDSVLLIFNNIRRADCAIPAYSLIYSKYIYIKKTDLCEIVN